MAKIVKKKIKKVVKSVKVSKPKTKAKVAFTPKKNKSIKRPLPLKKAVPVKASKKIKQVKPVKKAPKVIKFSKPIKSVKKVKPVKVVKPTKKVVKPTKPFKPEKPAKVVKPALKVKTKATKKSAKQIVTPPAVAINAPARKFPKPLFPIKGPKISLIPDSIVTPHGKKQVLNKKFLGQQKQKLLDLRDILLDQMQGVAKDNLRSRAEGSEASAFGMHQADAGSDTYEKDFALSLLSQEQDALYEIEEALKRVELGGYGICEMSGKTIPLNRLEAIPFARFTRDCQEQAEKEQKGKHRWETAAQFMDSTDNFFEEEEEGDEEEKPKLKE